MPVYCPSLERVKGQRRWSVRLVIRLGCSVGAAILVLVKRSGLVANGSSKGPDDGLAHSRRTAVRDQRLHEAEMAVDNNRDNNPDGIR